MKRIISVIIAFLMLLSTFNVFADASPEKLYLFVQAGAEDGDGSKANPFGTFEEARDKIREIKSKGEYPEGGVVVYFREGIYQVDKAIVLKGEQDSGTDEGPIVYRSYMEEQVTFVGGAQISVSEFKPVTDAKAKRRLNTEQADNIVVINLYDRGITDLGELNYYGGGSGYFTQPLTKLIDNGIPVPTEQPPEVFFDDVVGTIARYPNNDFTTTGEIIQMGDEVQMWSDTFKTYDTFVQYEDRVYPPKPSIYKVQPDVAERMKNWEDEDDIWVYGYFSENWSDTSLQVREIDAENGVITTELPSPKPIRTDKRYYVYNVLPELDVPGEYYLDRQSGDLYIYPINTKGTVTFSSLSDNFITMSDLDNVSFKSLSFKGTRSTAIALYGCGNITIEHCSVSKAAKRALYATNTTNCKFVSCHFYQLGTGGLYMSNDLNGARKEVAIEAQENLIPQNNVIENCEINDFGRINATYSPAIGLGGCGNIVRHCKMHDGEHMVMSPGNNDCIIEYNEFYDLLRTADDSGALYDGYSKTRRGNVIRNNYFHDIKSSSGDGKHIAMIYGDDTKDGYIVEQNIFENISGRALYLTGGRAHTVKNNIAINLDTFLCTWTYLSDVNGKYGIGQYKFPDFLDNPAYAKYPHFTDLSPALEDYLPAKWNVVNNNVVVNVNNDVVITSESFPAENDINPSLAFSAGDDPGFMNMPERNYILRDDSVIYETYPDFQAPDFKNMGMYTDMTKILMGDETVAMLEGSPKAYAGFEPEEITSRHDAYPVNKDGNLHLPLRYTAESFGAKVGYDAETEEVTITIGENKTVLKPEEYMSVNGNTLVTSEKISQILGIQIKVFENGLILVGNDIKIGDGEDHVKYTQELVRRLCNE